MSSSSHTSPPSPKTVDKIFAVVLALVSFLVQSPYARAIEITAAIDSFDATNIEGFQLNGVAALNGSSIRLTPSAGAQAGSAFWKRRVSLLDDRSFSAYFTFQITNPVNSGADGIVFTIQSQSNTAGSAGGGIGFQGIPTSFGIEFDTWDNGVGAGDPNGNHIGVDVSGSVNSLVTLAVTTINGAWALDDGGEYHAWVDYISSTNTLEVRLNRNSDTRPGAAALTHNINLSDYFPEDVYFGFTAATGGAWEAHDINSFYFNSDDIVGGIDPMNQTYESAPYAVSVTTTANTIDANGVSTSVATVTVTDVQNQPLNNRLIAFETSDGTLNVASGSTNAQGTVQVTITSSTTPGTATFRATASGGAYGEANVQFANVAPVITQGASTSVSMTRNGTLTPFSLTLNATDVNNETLTWSISSAATHGTASTSGTGTSKAIAYTPTADYVGTDSFIVTVTDASAGIDSITVNVTISIPDTDNDGLNDDDEIAAGSDPTDRGSFPAQLTSPLCASWNGFWSGLLNVFEHVNLSSSPRFVLSSLYEDQGTELGNVSLTLDINQQFDILVHDLPERQSDRYGQICTRHDGGNNDVEGRLVYYKLSPNTELRDLKFDFAFALDTSSGRTQSQSVVFNTFSPSLDPTDQLSRVANWIIVSNLSDTTQAGTLYYYDQNGDELGTATVVLPGKGEQHYPAHQFGQNLVGLVVWSPGSSTARFTLRNIRYVYDNDLGQASFLSATGLEGGIPSGKLLGIPVDSTNGSSILEIANSLPTAISAVVTIYGANGTQLHQETLALDGHSTRHLILDTILNGARGVATIDGSVAESIVAYALQYGRTASGGITDMYAHRAEEAIGSLWSTSYNSWLGQGCALLIANLTATATSGTMTLRSSDGSSISSSNIDVPANGLTTTDVCSQVTPDSYGTLTLATGTANALVASILRTGDDGQYRFSLPLH